MERTLTINSPDKKTVLKIRNFITVGYILLVTGYIIGKNTKFGKKAVNRGQELLAQQLTKAFVLSNTMLEKVKANERARKILTFTPTDQ